MKNLINQITVFFKGDFGQINSKFNTTIKSDLTRIAKLSQLIDPRDMEDFEELCALRIIKFYTRKNSGNPKKMFPHLSTLKVRGEYTSFTVWQADIEEYYNIYRDSYTDFVSFHVEHLRELVNKNLVNPQYYYLFNKYEVSIHLVANTIEDSIELNGVISEEVKTKAEKIIRVFGRAVKKRENEIESLKNLEKVAENKSHIDRLDNEIEYIEKFVDIN